MTLVPSVYGSLGADGLRLDLEAQHAPIFELELTTQKRVGVPHLPIGRTCWNQQLDFAAAHVDVYGLVAFSVVVE